VKAATEAKAGAGPVKKARKAQPKAIPSVDFIRICRWLEGGSCADNCRAMAQALKLAGSSKLGKQGLIAAIVEALETRPLPPTFKPTLDEVALGDDEFNDKWAGKPVFKIAEVCALLEGL
jgi:hypothetical protein